MPNPLSVTLVILLAVLISACSTAKAADEDFFPITSWELPLEKQKQIGDPVIGVTGLRDCGFTAAAFVTGDQVPLCEKAGMRALVALPGSMVKWRELSDRQIEDTVKQLVGPAPQSKAVLGYMLADEPGAGDFPALAKAVAAVKRLAPGKLAYINLFPDYATLGAPNLSQLGTQSYAEYLDRYINEVKPQFISYDNYRVQYSNDLKDHALAAGYFANLLEIRRIALKYDLPFWNIVASNQQLPEMPIPSPANLSFQAYTTLAAGGRGLTWYTYYAGGYQYAAVDREGKRTATWAYLKMINDQVKVLGPMMNRLRSTGLYFTSPAPAGSLPTLPGQSIESLASDTPIMIGEFSGPGNSKWAMLVNLSLEGSTKVTIKLRPGLKETLTVSPVDGSMRPPNAAAALRLTAGGGVLMQFN